MRRKAEFGAGRSAAGERDVIDLGHREGAAQKLPTGRTVRLGEHWPLDMDDAFPGKRDADIHERPSGNARDAGR